MEKKRKNERGGKRLILREREREMQMEKKRKKGTDKGRWRQKYAEKDTER